MTNKKILEVLEFYENYLITKRVERIKVDYEKKPSKKEAHNHLLSMIPQTREFLKSGRRRKVFRWLGFMQGVFWKNSDFTLNELKSHSKPKKERK